MSLCRRRLVASAKLPKCNNTGEMVRTSDLGVMSPARFLCATPVTWFTVFKVCRRRLVASVKLPKCNNTGDPFRSGVLKVMSLARCRCATPVTWFTVFKVCRRRLVASVKLPKCRCVLIACLQGHQPRRASFSPYGLPCLESARED